MTTFPTSLDNFTNPTASSNMTDVGVLHADQHTNANDAIEAIESVIGTTNSVDSASVEYRLARKQPSIALSGAPASASAVGVAGSIVVSGGFIYVCTATNTWVRAAVATW